ESQGYQRRSPGLVEHLSRPLPPGSLPKKPAYIGNRIFDQNRKPSPGLVVGIERLRFVGIRSGNNGSQQIRALFDQRAPGSVLKGCGMQKTRTPRLKYNYRLSFRILEKKPRLE